MEMNSDSHHRRSCSPCCAIVKNVKMLTISVILYDFKIKYFYDTYPLSGRCLVCYGAEAPVVTGRTGPMYAISVSGEGQQRE